MSDDPTWRYIGSEPGRRGCGGGQADVRDDPTWLYIRSEPGLWTVGFYRPDSRWEPESDHGTAAEAAARVHYLNGGEQT